MRLASCTTLSNHHNTSGMTIAEVMVASSILAMVSASLLIGISTLQRTFRASEHHAKSQIEQARVLDYIGRDVRRATSSPTRENNGQKITLQIPDYYQSGAKTSYTVDDKPRDPVRSGSGVKYGTGDISVSYYKSGSTIYRSIAGTAVPIVEDVEDFKLEFPNDDRHEVEIQVKFRPRYSFRNGNAAMEDGTMVKTRILLRNLR